MKNSRVILASMLAFVCLGLMMAQSPAPVSSALATARGGLASADTAFNGITHTDASGNISGMTTDEYNDLLKIQSYEGGIAGLQVKYSGR